MEVVQTNRAPTAFWRVSAIGAAALAGVLGAWWTAAFAVLSEFPAGAYWKDLWVISFSSALLGLPVTGLVMLFLISPMAWSDFRRGVRVWSKLLGVFAFGCAIGLAHHRVDAWVFRAEANGYVAGGGREQYRRVQWWPRRGGEFAFTYPHRFHATD